MVHLLECHNGNIISFSNSQPKLMATCEERLKFIHRQWVYSLQKNFDLSLKYVFRSH